MRYLSWIFITILILSVTFIVYMRVWVESVLTTQTNIDRLSIEVGMTANDVVSILAPDLSARERWLLFTLEPRFAHIQAGTYEFGGETTILDALEKLHVGDAIIERFTIPEGLTTRVLLTRVNEATQFTGEAIHWRSTPLSPAFLHPEGAYLAETYLWRRKMSRAEFLELTHKALLEAIDEAWHQTDSDIRTILESPYALLILASIVEKETALASERPRIAGVFINRLRLGMKLQTDPTVIYGLGDRFDGNLTREHLREDTPYNTYHIDGLPPTPVALVGPDALMAVAQPKFTGDLYFVANGAGGHVFSKTLDEHNSNVRKFQLERLQK